MTKKTQQQTIENQTTPTTKQHESTIIPIDTLLNTHLKLIIEEVVLLKPNEAN
jgi:hypothetical protein